MAQKTLRRTQAVIPFGVGALVDFPGESLISAGLDVWPDNPECRINDDRLAKRLNVKYFRSPPPAPKEGQEGAYLLFIRFPLWHFCPRCRAMKKTSWNDIYPPRCDSNLLPRRTGLSSCSQLPEKRRCRMVPLRFIVACENAHIDDFPWISWAHSKGKPLDSIEPCEKPVLRFNYTGKAGLVGLLVKCENCKASRSLMGAAGANVLKGLKCMGNRPWLGPHGKETCEADNPPRMLQTGATNLYFSKIMSSILIPPFSNRLRKIIDEPNNWEILTSGIEENGPVDEPRLKLFAEMKKLDFHDLKNEISAKIKGVGFEKNIKTEEDYRFSEYKAILNSSPNDEHDFITEKQKMSDYAENILEYIDQIILVKKLAETRVLTGFSRIHPPVSCGFDNTSRAQMSLQPKPWLPGIRVYGEGIFLTLKDLKIKEWLNNIESKIYEKIFEHHKTIYNELGREPREIPVKFFLLHTLAHIMILRLSFQSGYGSSSLRERLYCLDRETQTMNGILIYTAAGDSEGTMGGLVEQGKPGSFEALFEGAIKQAIWCSNDPICIESRGQGTDSLNRAACHSCTLLPETSCEEGNRFLDRGSLIGRPDNLSAGFFYHSVESILSG